MPGDEVDEIGAPEVTRRLHVIAANEATRHAAGGRYPAPTLPPVHHHPDCPTGADCWCTGRWIRREGDPCQCHPKETK